MLPFLRMVCRKQSRFCVRKKRWALKGANLTYLGGDILGMVFFEIFPLTKISQSVDNTSHMGFTTIDLFSGCGGISEGLREADFDVVAAADNNPKYSITYKKNFSGVKFIDKSLSDLDPYEFMELVGIRVGQLDLLTGGPPCQGFSKNVPRSQREIDSKNNLLVTTFLEYCTAIRPKAILMENVAEMRNSFDETYTLEIKTTLGKLGYVVNEGVLNAADYGIPQRRRRAFFVALNDESLQFIFPPPTHQASTEQNFFIKPYLTVNDAVADLPRLKDGEGEEQMQYTSAPFSEYQKQMRKGSNILFNHKTRKLRETQYNRLACLRPGEGIKQLPDNLRPKGGYSGAYGRLTWDMVPPTITRWIFHPGSGRWGHPEDIRILTTRETARIQSFPDSFRFFGSFTDMAGQLGNAVPPLIGKILGEAIAQRLNRLKKHLHQIVKT